MQITELEASSSAVPQKAGKPDLTLVIGNKNYSSWSMRPWVALTAFGIPFKEVRILLDQADTASEIARYSTAGRVPVLLVGDTSIWDSLAICEYLAEQYPECGMWPKDVLARAIARSVCAEMHSGFNGLRTSMTMDIRGQYPGKGRTAATQADIARIVEIWENCLSKFGHHQFLFGDFSIADAFFAPVVTRFRTYGVPLAPALQAYAERVQAHPAVAQWMREAAAEPEELPDHR
ncbi:glutathione S-transferase family protein [Paraherbaspirillum soli]|uniref:Glutathione S-transferase family protein n=1 Tax=Paraherbaspirillum soli TaxID=631222 RepID=A0ABW0M2M7_9BURK